MKNRIVFKIERGYKLELLSPETMKLLKMHKKDVDWDKDGEDLPKLESAGVVLVHCNLVNNNYQQTSEVLFTFVPNKQFGQLINIALHSLTIPLKKCWNFKAVFQRTAVGNPEVNILNHSGF